MAKITYEQAENIEQAPDSTPNYNVNEYSGVIDNIFKRIVGQIENTIAKTGETKTAVFEKGISEIPISIDTWHKYTRYVNKSKNESTNENTDESTNKNTNEKGTKKSMDMKLETFYGICRYTGVSADYLLCFNDVPNKKASAKQIQEDYGLTPESLDSIEEINQRTKRFVEQGLTSDEGYATEHDFLNFLITKFATQFLVSMYHYFYVLDKYEEFEKEHFNMKRKLKRKFLSNDEQRVIDEYQELVTKVDTERFILMQKVYRLVDEFREDLKKAALERKRKQNNKQKAAD